MTMRRPRFLLAAALLAACLPLGVVPARADEPIGVAVGVDPAYSPLFLAKQADLFKAAGVSVKLVQYTQGGDALDSVLAGQNALAGTSEATTLNRAARGDIKALAVFSQSGKFIKLVVRPGIDDVHQIKTFGIVPASVNDFATAKLLSTFNIDPHSVRFVNGAPPDFPALLARGDIDGYVLWEPWPSNGVKAGGHVLMTTGDFGYAYNLLILANGPWLQTHAEQAQDVIKAVAQACDMITADPKKAGDATQAEVKIPSATAIDLLRDVTCKVRDFTAQDVATYKEIAQFLFDRKVTRTLVDVDAVLVKGFYKP